MTILDRLPAFVSKGELRDILAESRANSRYSGHVKERLHELEAGLRGGDAWEIMGGAGDREFSNSARKTLNRLAGLMYLKNPLIRRSVEVQVDYVFARGVTVHVTNDDAANVALQEFWDDQANGHVLTSPEALQVRERDQQLTGEHFFVFFANKVTGRVSVRTWDPDEIMDVVTNPEDRDEPWFYKRVWSAKRLDFETGQIRSEPRTAYYPDWTYNPARKPATIAGHPIEWDAPIYHVKTGGLPRQLRGLCEIFPLIDWAKAYSRFLEDRSTVANALSKFVLKFKAATAAGVAATKEALRANAYGSRDKSAGDSAVVGAGRDVEAMSVKGATINPDEGRRLLLMVAAGAGLPETFYGDVSVGTLATATSLDQPTKLKFTKRQGLWTTVLTNIATLVLVRAARAGANPFSAQVQYIGATPKLLGADGKPVEIQVDWPPLVEQEIDKQVSAIEKVAKMLKKPRLIATLLLNALGVNKVDEIVANIPEDGDVIAPKVTPGTPPNSGEPALADDEKAGDA